MCVCPPSNTSHLLFLPNDAPRHVTRPEPTTPLPLTQDEDVDMDEVECILANLIHQRYIKGYIAHAQKILVCSPDNAFPTIKKA